MALKIAELKIREDYAQNLGDTIANAVRAGARLGWTEAAGGASEPDAVAWRLHPFFGIYATPKLSSKARHFLREMFAHSPEGSRRIAQKAVVSALSLPIPFRAALQNGFHSSATPHPDDSFWMPGNFRFRYFDFAAETVYVFPKAHFSSDGIDREIAFRAANSDRFSWLEPICSVSPNDHAFAEKLQSAVAFNRIPDGFQQALLPSVYAALDDLKRLDAQDLTPSEYLALKSAEFENAKAAFSRKFRGADFSHLDDAAERARRIVGKAHHIPVCASHGDFQPGNILVRIDRRAQDQTAGKKLFPHLNAEETSCRIAIIDWEDVAARASIYDDMTFAYRTRSPQNLDRRLRCPDASAHRLPASIDFETASALWFIEEWIWLLDASSRRGISRIPAGIREHFRMLARSAGSR